MEQSSALLQHLLSRIDADIGCLQNLGLVNPGDAALIRSKLPAANSLQSNNLMPPSPAQSYNSNAPTYGAPFSQNNTAASRPPPPPPSRSTGPPEIQARAQWDYGMAGNPAPDDLVFRKDDVIIITEEVNNDWWKGRLSHDNGPNPRIGIFPSAYVQKMPSNALVPVSNASSMALASNGSYGEKQNYYPPQQYNQGPPPQQYQQQYQQGPPVQYQQPGSVIQQPPAAPAKPPGKFDGMGKLLATSAVGGLGFGVGSAVGGDLVHAIF